MKRLGKYAQLDDDSGEVVVSYDAEFPDPTPVEVPARFSRPPTLEERMKMFIRSEKFKEYVESQGAESFEEADDFEIDDEDELTPHELAAIMTNPEAFRKSGNPDVAKPDSPTPEGSPAPAAPAAEPSAPS